MSTGFFWGWWNVLELVVLVGQPCKYTKMNWIVHFKMVTFMVCELYVNKNTEIIKGITYAQKKTISPKEIGHGDSFGGGDGTGR